jgi:hypothetical protein
VRERRAQPVYLSSSSLRELQALMIHQWARGTCCACLPPRVKHPVFVRPSMLDANDNHRKGHSGALISMLVAARVNSAYEVPTSFSCKRQPKCERIRSVFVRVGTRTRSIRFADPSSVFVVDIKSRQTERIPRLWWQAFEENAITPDMNILENSTLQFHDRLPGGMEKWRCQQRISRTKACAASRREQ